MILHAVFVKPSLTILHGENEYIYRYLREEIFFCFCNMPHDKPIFNKNDTKEPLCQTSKIAA